MNTSKKIRTQTKTKKQKEGQEEIGEILAERRGDRTMEKTGNRV